MGAFFPNFSQKSPPPPPFPKNWAGGRGLGVSKWFFFFFFCFRPKKFQTGQQTGLIAGGGPPVPPPKPRKAPVGWPRGGNGFPPSPHPAPPKWKIFGVFPPRRPPGVVVPDPRITLGGPPPPKTRLGAIGQIVKYRVKPKKQCCWGGKIKLVGWLGEPPSAPPLAPPRPPKGNQKKPKNQRKKNQPIPV